MSDQRIRELGLKLGQDTTDTNLDAVPRSLARADLEPMPTMFGHDLWNAYETGFIRANGVPCALHARIRYEANTPNIVESKSLKLYLNALTDETFLSEAQFADQISRDVGRIIGGPVFVELFAPGQSPQHRQPSGTNIDDRQPHPGERSDILAQMAQPAPSSPFAYHSHLLRSNCPVTGQPDWGCITVEGLGGHHPKPSTLLGYVLSFRSQQDFHESCCETIYRDLHHVLKPDSLTVHCQYTRRGGIDINPIRSNRPLITKDNPWQPVWRQ